MLDRSAAHLVISQVNQYNKGRVRRRKAMPSQRNLQRNSSFFAARSLFLVTLTLAIGFADAVASAAPVPVGGGKPRPAVYALLHIVRRPGVSTPEAYSRHAAQFKNV